MLLNTANNAMPAPKTSIFHSMCNARTRLLWDKIMPNCLYFTELCPPSQYRHVWQTELCRHLQGYNVQLHNEDFIWRIWVFSHLIQQHYHPQKNKRKRVNSPRRYQIIISFCSLNISIHMQTMYTFESDRVQITCYPTQWTMNVMYSRMWFTLCTLFHSTLYKDKILENQDMTAPVQQPFWAFGQFTRRKYSSPTLFKQPDPSKSRKGIT